MPTVWCPCLEQTIVALTVTVTVAAAAGLAAAAAVPVAVAIIVAAVVIATARRPTGRATDQSVGRSTGRSIHRTLDRSAGRSPCRPADGPSGRRPVGRPVGQPDRQSGDWSAGRPAGPTSGSPGRRSLGRPAGRTVSRWSVGRSVGRPVSRPAGRVDVFPNSMRQTSELPVCHVCQCTLFATPRSNTSHCIVQVVGSIASLTGIFITMRCFFGGRLFIRTRFSRSLRRSLRPLFIFRHRLGHVLERERFRTPGDRTTQHRDPNGGGQHFLHDAPLFVKVRQFLKSI